jgi:hypothetical protein
MKFSPVFLSLCVAFFCAESAFAESPSAAPGEAALSALGQLNGQSLACKQEALSARTRQIVIDVVPKERPLGEIFEQATSAAFLKQGTDGLSCPDSKTLSAQIEAQEKVLKLRFPGKP